MSWFTCPLIELISNNVSVSSCIEMTSHLCVNSQCSLYRLESREPTERNIWILLAPRGTAGMASMPCFTFKMNAEELRGVSIDLDPKPASMRMISD